MRYLHRFAQLSLMQRVVWIVVSAHLALLAFACMSMLSVPRATKQAERLLVQTVTLCPPPPAQVPVVAEKVKAKLPPKAVAQAQAQPKTQVKANSKAVVQRKPVVDRSVESKPIPSHPKVSPDRKRLADQLKKQLAQTKVSAPPQPRRSPPARIQSDVKSAPVDPAYKASVVEHLQKFLCLPDFGAVEVEVEIDPRGRLVRWKLVQSHSLENQRYIEQNLPKLAFPPRQGVSQGSQVFVINLSNRF